MSAFPICFPSVYIGPSPETLDVILPDSGAKILGCQKRKQQTATSSTGSLRVILLFLGRGL
jgi:hypothetical protein